MPELDVDGLQRILWHFASHRLVTTASRTGILRRLATSPATPAELADDLGLDRAATGKVVRALAALGVVAPSGGRFLVPAPLRGCFLPGEDDMAPFLEHAHRMYDGWGANLESWLRGGVWPRRAPDPDHAEVFGAAMRAMGRRIARRVAAALDLDDVDRVLDVGGGFGQYAEALCEESPELEAIVLDRPEVIELGRRTMASRPAAGRIRFVPGDYLESDFGAGFDLVLLANVLHQETASDASRLIRRAARALAPGGRLAVVDFAIDDHKREHVLGTLFAVNMRDFGDTWTESDIRGWMQAAGLGQVERVDIGPDRWLITGRASRLRTD